MCPGQTCCSTAPVVWHRTRFNQTQQLDIVITTGGTTSTGTQAISTPTWRFGWVAGAGVETRLWDSNWLARIEYLHFDFRDSGNFISTGGGGLTTDNLTVDVVRAGLSYKFGLGPWAGTASAAYAADMPVKAPRVAGAPWTWSGFYLGGHVGYGWGRDPFNEVGFSPGLSGSIPMALSGACKQASTGKAAHGSAASKSTCPPPTSKDRARLHFQTLNSPRPEPRPINLRCWDRRARGLAMSSGQVCWSMAPAAWRGLVSSKRKKGPKLRWDNRCELELKPELAVWMDRRCRCGEQALGYQLARPDRVPPLRLWPVVHQFQL